jgi:transcriptional regulator with XRE-family HTH domain
MYYIRVMKTLRERLVWARLNKGDREGREYTQQVLADKAGVSQSTIGNLESGIRLTARKLVSIAKALDVSPEWLSDGIGKPFDSPRAINQSEGVLHKSGSEDTDESDRVIELLAHYQAADAHGREMIIDFAKSAGLARAVRWARVSGDDS